MAVERHALLTQLKSLLGDEGLLWDLAARRVYSLDSSHLTLGMPWVVALPETPRQVSKIVELCFEARVPVVCRGNGTGLSGGAVPHDGALVLGTGRLNGAGRVSTRDRSISVQVGILNESVSQLAAADNLHFAPDPSSQAIATIGGNIAENAGGPHCLRYGVTLQHLQKLRWVDAQGKCWSTGRGLPFERGFDLNSLLCGSEGTLAVVISADLKLVANAEAVTTLLAFFPDLHQATRSVVSLLTSGLLPVAVEMIDQAMLIAVEEAFGFGFPTDVQGALIAEFTGSTQEVQEDVGRASLILKEAGAREVQEATDPTERQELWKCRKKAFGAVGRLAPRYVTMDVVVPLGRLPELVLRIQEIKARYGVDIATAFHAGDGNLHPGVHYDDRQAGQEEKAHRAADEIIRAALEMDGSATGEHGVGIEKLHVLPWQLDSETLRLSRGIKKLFDPENQLNPGKVLPEKVESGQSCKPLPETPLYRWESMSVTAPASTPLAEIQGQALERGLCLPVGVFRVAETGTLGLGAATTVGDLLTQQAPGPAFLAQGLARDFLLEFWARTGDGRLFHTGAPVFKNVAGYNLGQALCGSGKPFVVPLAATFQLRPVCEALLAMSFIFDPENPGMGTRLGELFQEFNNDDSSSPVVIVDWDQGQVSLTLGGRDRSWGLEAQADRIQKHLAGFSLQQQAVLKPLEVADFLVSSSVPTWAQASASWSVVCCPAGKISEDFFPSRTKRWIWQGVPGLWWTPDEVLVPAPWYEDRILQEGEMTPLPDPTGDIPQALMSDLKKLFDPRGDLDP